MDIVDVEAPRRRGGRRWAARRRSSWPTPLAGGGRAHHGHRRPRPSTWPRTATVPRHPRRAGHHLPGRRHGLHLRGGLRRGRPDRLPAARAPQLRAGRARHGHRLRRRTSWRRTWPRRRKISPDHPVYLDRFLEGAVEVDLDALCDGERGLRGRRAGAHRDGGHPLGRLGLLHAALRAVRGASCRSCAPSRADLALRLGVVGLINIQFAIKDQVVYIIEANPRASRTVPFVSKATGVPLAKCAARIMAGEKIADLGLPARRPAPRALQREGSRHALRPLPRRATRCSGPR